MNARRILGVIVTMSSLVWAGPVVADLLPQGSGPGAPGGVAFAPRVPVSAFARPASWFDASRLHVSTTVSVGTGWGGRTDALQVTSLSYQLASPLAVRLSVGNAFGASAAERGRGMFLEGFSVAYRPHPAFQINVDYRDVRSPLQYQNSTGFGTFGR